MKKEIIRKLLKRLNPEYRFAYIENNIVTFYLRDKNYMYQNYTIPYIKILASRIY